MGTTQSRMKALSQLLSAACRSTHVTAAKHMSRNGFAQAARQFSSKMVTVTFIEDGEEIECTAKEGTSLLDVAWDNDIQLEGACEATLCCSTCHVYLEEEFFDKVPEATEEELDMLDLAAGLEDNSRLVCQVQLSAELNGMRVVVPDEAAGHY